MNRKGLAEKLNHALARAAAGDGGVALLEDLLGHGALEHRLLVGLFKAREHDRLDVGLEREVVARREERGIAA